MKDIKEMLELFAYNLAGFSPNIIDEPIKIVLPFNLYNQFRRGIEEEIYPKENYSINGRIKFNSTSGVSFIITCKEFDKENLSSKLHNLFKDIINDNSN